MKLHCLFLSTLSAASALIIPQQSAINSLVARAGFEDVNMDRPSGVEPVLSDQPEKDAGPAYGSREYEDIIMGEDPPYRLGREPSEETDDVEEVNPLDLKGTARNDRGDRVYILEYTEFDGPEMRQNFMADSVNNPDKNGMVFTKGARYSSGTPSLAEIRKFVHENFGVRMMKPGEVFPFPLRATNSYSISHTDAFGRISNIRIFVEQGTELGFEKKLIDIQNNKAGLRLEAGPAARFSEVEDTPKPINEETPTQDTEPFPEYEDEWDQKMLAEEFHQFGPFTKPNGKRDVMVDIKSAGTNQTAKDYQSSYQKYLSAFETAQEKAIGIVFPFLEAFINGTNSSMVYDAAWSIYSELTFAPVQVIGPFTMGLGCMDWFEEKLFNGTNSTVESIMAKKNPTANEVAMLQAVVVGWELQQAYQLTYNATLAALKSSGVLGDMITLSSYLMPNDSSIIPAYMKEPATDPNTPFFTQWRKNTS